MTFRPYDRGIEDLSMSYGIGATVPGSYATGQPWAQTFGYPGQGFWTQPFTHFPQATYGQQFAHPFFQQQIPFAPYHGIGQPYIHPGYTGIPEQLIARQFQPFVNPFQLQQNPYIGPIGPSFHQPFISQQHLTPAFLPTQQFGIQPLVNPFLSGWIDPAIARQIQPYGLSSLAAQSQLFGNPLLQSYNPQPGYGQIFGQFGGGLTSETEWMHSLGLSLQRLRRAPKGYRRSDEMVRDDIVERLTIRPEVDASGMEIVVRDGEVTLRGTVEDRLVKRIAEDVAESVFGVKDVVNELRVSPPYLQSGREREQEMTGVSKGKEK